MLLGVEGCRVEPFEDALARYQDRHGLAEDITDDSQEDDGNRELLRLEGIDGSQDRGEQGKSKTWRY